MKYIFLLLTLLAMVCNGTIGYAAPSPSLGIIPSPSVASVGDTVKIAVTLSSIEEGVNAVSGSLVLPDSLKFQSIDTSGSIVSFWVEEPHVVARTVRFEGVTLNPGFIGTNGRVFTVTCVAMRPGTHRLVLSDGSALRNDGTGTNILETLGVATISIRTAPTEYIQESLTPSSTEGQIPTEHVVAFPVITEYSSQISEGGFAYLHGLGQPFALTKLEFTDVDTAPLKTQLQRILVGGKKKLDTVLIKNDEKGAFQYTSPSDLVAGAYIVTPFLIDERSSAEQPGLAVEMNVAPKSNSHLLSPITVMTIVVLLGISALFFLYKTIWTSWHSLHLTKKLVRLQDKRVSLYRHARIISSIETKN